MNDNIAKQGGSHSSYLFTRTIYKQTSPSSALPDLRHVFSFQFWSHSWYPLTGVDYLCRSWSWRLKNGILYKLGLSSLVLVSYQQDVLFHETYLSFNNHYLIHQGLWSNKEKNILFLNYASPHW